MFFQPRVQTVGSVSEFMSGGSDIEVALRRFNKKAAVHGVKAFITTLAGTTFIGITSFTNNAYAQGPAEYVKGKAKEQIVDAFMPLVDMIQALSYPIALVMLTGGALMFMINQKDKGISLIQNASIGYILVQLMPLLMGLLVGIGNTVA
jgi:hypothetical protein